MSKPAVPSPVRRADALTFDPATRCLTLGGHQQVVPPDAGNRGVLNAYIELMARCRADKIANLGHVRHEDTEALAQALDLDADDLEQEVLEILGAAHADALRLATAMKRSRRIGGLAAAALAAAPPARPAWADGDDEGDDAADA